MVQGGPLYKVKIDGSQNQVLWDYHLIRNLNAFDGWAYFYNNTENNIYRINPKTSAIENVTTYGISDFFTIDYINIIDSWLFVYNETGLSKADARGVDGELFKIRPDGSNLSKMQQAWNDGYQSMSTSIEVEEETRQKNEQESEKVTQQQSIKYLGNSYGNLSNLGFSVAVEDEIIYVNDLGMNGGGSTLIMNKDGTNMKQFMDTLCMPMDYDGEFLYYAHFMFDDGIFRIRPDQSQKVKIADDTAIFLTVKEEWIYYVNAYSSLYRMQKDGTQRISLTESEEEIAFINVVGEDIYYIEMIDESGLITHIKNDGSQKKYLNDDEALLLIYDEGWLYYINITDDAKVYRMRTDGSQATKILDVSCMAINIDNGWLYYAPFIDKGLHRIDLNSGETKILFEDNLCILINIVGDNLYCLINEGEDNKIIVVPKH